MSILQARIERGVAIVDVEGRLLGGPETSEMRERVRELLREGHRKILLNLKGVPWVNSVALGAIVAAWATARRDGARLEICCPSRRVEMLFRSTTLMPDLIGEFLCEDEALRSLQQEKGPASK